jgi:hypothetical protein
VLFRSPGSLRPASLTPPPLPPTPVPGGVPSPVPPVGPDGSRGSAAPAPRRSRWWLAAVALPLGVGAAWGGMVLLAGGRVKVVEITKAGPPAVSASAPSIDLADIPVTGQGDSGAQDRVATCVAGYLPKGAFPGKPPDLGWICSERDPRNGGAKLRTAVVAGGSGKFTDAMKLVSELGWYQMAAFAVVSTGCCPDAQPLGLPDPSAGCPSMTAALGELGAQVVDGSPHDDAEKRFAAAVDCEVKAHRASLFKQKSAPDPQEKNAFDEFVRVPKTP